MEVKRRLVVKPVPPGLELSEDHVNMDPIPENPITMGLKYVNAEGILAEIEVKCFRNELAAMIGVDEQMRYTSTPRMRSSVFYKCVLNTAPFLMYIKGNRIVGIGASGSLYASCAMKRGFVTFSASTIVRRLVEQHVRANRDVKWFGYRDEALDALLVAADAEPQTRDAASSSEDVDMGMDGVDDAIPARFHIRQVAPVLSATVVSQLVGRHDLSTYEAVVPMRRLFELVDPAASPTTSWALWATSAASASPFASSITSFSLSLFITVVDSRLCRWVLMLLLLLHTFGRLRLVRFYLGSL